MSQKFLYVDSGGFYTEALGYLTSEFLNASSGAGDAGKPVVLDAAGHIDATMINDADIDHGTLTGLGDDDHSQYSLVAGTRAYTGKQSYSTGFTFTGDNELITKKYADDLFTGNEWQNSVIDADIVDPTALSPSTGDRYLINGTGAGAWTGHDNEIAEWTGSAWSYTSPTTGMKVSADDETDKIYLYGGSAWVAKFYEVTTASTGLTKVGVDIRMDASAGGDGLGFTAGVLNVNVDDSSIETNADTLRVKALGITDAMLAGSISDGKLANDYIITSEVDGTSIEFGGGTLNVKADGINDTHIDWGLGANQVNDADLPVTDTNGYFTGSTQSAVNDELYEAIAEKGVIYTSGGVNKGDVCYVSANDTASTYGTISVGQRAIGLAFTTVAAASPVKIAANDTIITGVLSGATAGVTYYWDGSSLTSTIPAASGAYVIQAGIAKNATDLHVECRVIKKNI